MKYENHKMTDIKIAYIGGGSHGWAWTFMTDLAMESELEGTIYLYDIDETAAKNNALIGNHLFSRSSVASKWKFEVKTSLKEVLENVNFIVISILPGTFEEMESDVHLPEKYGIYQSVGDTAGPGGLLRALRTIPMYVEIGEAIKVYAPSAWVINYTNPMTLCVRTLYHVFPEIKAFGCCHEVFGTQKILKDICELETGMKDIEKNKIYVNVLGINHFTWFDHASYEGIDLFPIYRKFIEAHFEEGYHDPDRNWMNGTFNCAHRVKFDLFNKYGYIAAAGDRHLAEFLPGNIYLKDAQTVENWKFALTTVNWRKERQAEKNIRAQKLALGEEEIELKATGEEGILLIKALCGLDRVISNVNIPNTGKQIGDLPQEAVVETNAVFSKDNIQPIIAGDLPDSILDLITPHIKIHEKILKAALTYDFNLAFEAFMEDPLVKDRISQEEGRILLKDMLRNTISYLPSAWKQFI